MDKTEETAVLETEETAVIAEDTPEVTEATEPDVTEEVTEEETAVAAVVEDEPAADTPEEPEAKELSFNQIAHEVERVVDHMLEQHLYETPPEERRFNRWPSAVWTYDGYAIVKIALQYFRADYTITDNSIEMKPAAEWPEVEKTFTEMKRLENTVVMR